jgi:zinc-finger of the FCS-type, C2-C2
LKVLFIATLVSILFLIVYSRLRPYLQLIRKVLSFLIGPGGVNSPASPAKKQGNADAAHKLVRCVSCGTWIPADRAITMRSGFSTYCSRECLEKKASAKERKLAG